MKKYSQIEISRTLKTYIPVKLLAGMIAIVIYMYIMEQISIIKSAAIALIYYSVAIVLDYLVMLTMISIFGSLENVGNISETAGNSLIILSRTDRVIQNCIREFRQAKKKNT